MVTFLAQAAGEAAATGFAPLENVLTLLTQFGFFRVVLPFLLIFALMYAILMKTGVLGDAANQTWVKGISAVVSMTIAFFVISSTPVVNLMMTFIPQASFIILAAFFLLMILMFVFPGEIPGEGIDKKILGVVALILIIVFLGIIGTATPNVPFLSGLAQGLMGNFALPELSQQTIYLVIAVLVMFVLPLLIVWLVVRSSGAGP